MKSLKLSKEDVLVHSKWRRLIRSTGEDSDDSGGFCFWYRLTSLSWIEVAVKWLLFILFYLQLHITYERINIPTTAEKRKPNSS